MKKYVVFYRVSTKKQGESGLGLEAQQRDVNIFLDTYSDKPCEVISEHTSVHSGSNIEDCPHFQEALTACKNNGATLLVAKVDRLSRKEGVISSVSEEIDLVFASNPCATLEDLLEEELFAEKERDFISKRTKAALQEAKARGVKLGGIRKGHDKTIAAKKTAADNRAEKLRPVVTELLKSNNSYRSLAKALTAIKADDKAWQTTQVKRLMTRLNLELGKS